MNVPRDQGLFLTAFVAVSVSVILLTWLLMPVYHHRESEEGEPVVEASGANLNLVLSAQQLIDKADAAIQTGEAALLQLETGEEGTAVESAPEKEASTL